MNGAKLLPGPSSHRPGDRHAGTDFFFDPLIIVMGVIDDLDGGKEFPIAAQLHFSDEGYMMADLVLPPTLTLLALG